jgi:M6 family metalloprotease-like protein
MVTVYVDFSDAPGGDTRVEDLHAATAPAMERDLEALSEGRLDVTMDRSAGWVRADRPFASLGFGPSEPNTYERLRALVRSAMRAADPTLDFSRYAAVHVVTAPGAGLRASADPEAIPAYSADGRSIDAAAIYESTDDHRVFVHETLHLLGLPDLYPYREGVREYVGAWDVMSMTAQPTAPMTGWMRLLARWRTKRDFACIGATTNRTLSPVDAPGDGPTAWSFAPGARRPTSSRPVWTTSRRTAGATACSCTT